MGLMLGFMGWIDGPKLYRYQYTAAWTFLSRENENTNSHINLTASNSIQGENWLKITAIHYYWRITSLTKRPRVSLSSNLLCTLVGMVYHQYAHTCENLKPKLIFPILDRLVFFSHFAIYGCLLASGACLSLRPQPPFLHIKAQKIILNKIAL